MRCLVPPGHIPESVLLNGLDGSTQPPTRLLHKQSRRGYTTRQPSDISPSRPPGSASKVYYSPIIEDAHATKGGFATLIALAPQTWACPRAAGFLRCPDRSISILIPMHLSRSIRYWLLLSATLAWLFMIFYAPWARAHESMISFLIYKFFSSICHQLPERSFYLWGFPLAVCARCLGIYLGFGLALIVFPLFPSGCRILLMKPRLILLFVIPMGADLLWTNTLISRLVTGAIAAAPVSFFVWLAFEQFPFHRILRRNRCTKTNPAWLPRP